MRETIAEIQPNLSIRAVMREAGRVGWPVSANGALRRYEFHNGKVSTSVSANQIHDGVHLASDSLAK